MYIIELITAMILILIICLSLLYKVSDIPPAAQTYITAEMRALQIFKINNFN